jgi:hypothetical protein
MKAMRRINAYFGLLFLSIFLLASTALHAQAPAAGTTVSVKMIDTVNSGSDPAGKQYRASVTTAVTAANGISIAQGAAATVTLRSSGADYAAQLSTITINGQPVAVTSNSATVSGVAQYAQAKAASAVSSVLGGFGHHVSAPASVAAAATGQHVSLPTGTTLTFVLGASPAAPAAQTMTASAAPAPTPASSAAATSSASASGGITTLVVCYTDINALYLSAAFETPADRWDDATFPFANYLQATYHYSMGVKCVPMFTTSDVVAAQKQLASFAAHLKPIETGWRPGQPPLAPGQSGFDPVTQGAGGIDLSQHRLTTYFCSLTAAGGSTMAVDQHQPNWNANETTYISQLFDADWRPAPVSIAYKVYIRDHYVHDLDPSANLSPSCNAQSPGMQTMMHQTAMISNKRTGKSVAVDFSDTPAQGTAGNTAAAAANTASAAAAAALGPNQSYAFCNSDPGAPVVYFSDIFGASTPPNGGHCGNCAAQRNAEYATSASFQTFLKGKYSFNGPASCRTGISATALKAAQAMKQSMEDTAKQGKAQVVETGWKNQ